MRRVGSTSMATSHTGQPTEDIVFFPWGDVWLDSGSGGYNFAKLPYRDVTTNTDITLARFSSPNFGRWFSPDPIGKAAVQLADPQTWNTYAYVGNNPTTLTDPSGTCEFCDLFLAGFGSVVNNNSVMPDPEGLLNADENAEHRIADPTVGAQEQQGQNNVDSDQIGKTTVGALERTMSNEDRSLSGGAPGELENGKNALANAIINNAELDRPAKVAPSTGTATPQDAEIMRDAYTNRANGGADPVQGRTQFGTSHNSHLKSRSAGNHLKGKAGRETVYEKFGPFKDSTSRRPTYIYIYNNPGH
jgi:RHS repeat-associated protein